MEQGKPVAEAQAEEYNLLSVPQEMGGNLFTLIKQFSPSKSNRVILDLGCGTGNLTPLLAEFAGEGGRVIGVDPDEERLKVAREKFDGTLSNVEFLKGSGEDFPEGPYDLVFANLVMHWIENKAPVFRKIYENLRHGGHFVFNSQVGEIPHPDPNLDILWSAVKKHVVVYDMSADAYEELAMSHGFIVAHKVVGQREFSYPNIDFLVKFTFAVSNGNFVPDKALVERLKQQLGDESIKSAAVIGTFIFTKP